MQAGNHNRRVNEAEEEAGNRTGKVIEVGQAHAQPLAGRAQDGAQAHEGQEAGNEQREQRGEHEVHRALEVFVQEFL